MSARVADSAADWDQRFLAHVDLTAVGCWEWQGTRHPDGYGVVRIGSTGVPAHRVSWFLTYGPIPTGQWVLHHCDNPPCVRPDHLFLGDQAANMRDAHEKGRMHPGEAHGRHKLTEAEVLDIRIRYRAGGVRQIDLAAEFNVNRTTISAIVRRQLWAHLA
ncbi:MAG: HNH endonuclease [Candidatus Limnocylindrales bacterium]